MVNIALHQLCWTNCAGGSVLDQQFSPHRQCEHIRHAGVGLIEVF
jgi:hypothetical protein